MNRKPLKIYPGTYRLVEYAIHISSYDRIVHTIIKLRLCCWWNLETKFCITDFKCYLCICILQIGYLQMYIPTSHSLKTELDCYHVSHIVRLNEGSIVTSLSLRQRKNEIQNNFQWPVILNPTHVIQPLRMPVPSL